MVTAAPLTFRDGTTSWVTYQGPKPPTENRLLVERDEEWDVCEAVALPVHVIEMTLTFDVRGIQFDLGGRDRVTIPRAYEEELRELAPTAPNLSILLLNRMAAQKRAWTTARVRDAIAERDAPKGTVRGLCVVLHCPRGVEYGLWVGVQPCTTKEMLLTAPVSVLMPLIPQVIWTPRGPDPHDGWPLGNPSATEDAMTQPKAPVGT